MPLNSRRVRPRPEGFGRLARVGIREPHICIISPDLRRAPHPLFASRCPESGPLEFSNGHEPWPGERSPNVRVGSVTAVAYGTAANRGNQLFGPPSNCLSVTGDSFAGSITARAMSQSRALCPGAPSCRVGIERGRLANAVGAAKMRRFIPADVSLNWDEADRARTRSQIAFGRSLEDAELGQLDEVSSRHGIKGSLSAASPQLVRIADGKSSIARAELPAQAYSLRQLAALQSRPQQA